LVTLAGKSVRVMTKRLGGTLAIVRCVPPADPVEIARAALH
jgi:hypothetical protein